MITLTRLSGTAFLLNADLIERVDCTPDTVITLIDGTKYVVAEPLDIVLAEILDYRAQIVARATLFESAALAQQGRPNLGSTLGSGRLSAVPTRPERHSWEEDR